MSQPNALVVSAARELREHFDYADNDILIAFVDAFVDGEPDTYQCVPCEKFGEHGDIVNGHCLCCGAKVKVVSE